jgi:hypothetical protein
LADFEVALLDYCVISSHVHLLREVDTELWVLQEAPVPYRAKTGSENARNGPN